MKMKIDQAHYLWGRCYLLWSLFIYGLGFAQRWYSRVGRKIG